jgi:TetR/AcrR family transcriptional repressor of nem operon
MSAPVAMPHRERLLREGMRQLYARGFHGTTVDAILEASGVPKGSFYHHFGSKEAFTREVLRRYMEFQLSVLERWSRESELPTTELLAGYFGELADGFVRSDFRRACLAGKLSTEVAADSEIFRSQLGADMAAWKQAISRLLGRGQERGDVRVDRTAPALADTVLALIQGAFVVALASRETASLDSVRESLALLITPHAG